MNLKEIAEGLEMIGRGDLPYAGSDADEIEILRRTENELEQISRIALALKANFRQRREEFETVQTIVRKHLS